MQHSLRRTFVALSFAMIALPAQVPSALALTYTLPDLPGVPVLIPSSSSKSSSRSSVSSSKSSTSTTLSTFRQKVIDLVNAERRSRGIPELRSNTYLNKAAQTHSDDMVKRGYYSHNTLEGKTPTQQIRDAGYVLSGSWKTAQNIARGQTTPEVVVTAWMNSDGHRKNILNKDLKEIGVGYSYSSDKYHHYWVQDFASSNL